MISRTAARGGTVLVPSFAVDRTEVLLLELKRLVRAGKVPSLPVYADSPMALSVLDIYRRAVAEHDPEVALVAPEGEDPFDPGELHAARTVEDSKRLNTIEYPTIIVSASGMATGGRVLHHLLRCLPDNRCSVVLPGFQAEGTRGRLLADGARSVKLLGRHVPVRAEICVLDAYSAHADAEELVSWLGGAPSAPETAYLVHGEPAASAALADRITSELDWHAVVPTYGEKIRID